MRKLITYSTLILFFIILLLWLKKKDNNDVISREQIIKDNNQHDHPNITNKTTPNNSSVDNIDNLSDKRYKEIYEKQFNIHGVVYDQDNRPIGNSNITYEIIDKENFSKVWQGSIPSRNIKSNKEGRFQITATGAGVSITVSHPEYISTNSSYSLFPYYSPPHIIPKDKPHIFKLQYVGKPAYFQEFSPNKPILLQANSPIYITPQSGYIGKNPTAQGVLIKPLGEVYGIEHQSLQGEKYFSALHIEAINGGLLVKNHVDNYLAPTDGYLQNITVGHSLDDPPRKDIIDEYIYFKDSNGLYSYIHLVSINKRLRIKIHHCITGSNNLTHNSSHKLNK